MGSCCKTVNGNVLSWNESLLKLGEFVLVMDDGDMRLLPDGRTSVNRDGGSFLGSVQTPEPQGKADVAPSPRFADMPGGGAP